jgi:chaperonin GroEL
MARQVRGGPGMLQGAAAGAALRQGIAAMVETVRPTLGPLPRTVAVEDVTSGRPIEVLDDAATILRRIIELPDPYVSMGAMLLRHAVWRTYDRVGDGGATTAVLLQAIVRHVAPCLAAGGDPLLVRAHLQRGLALVTRALRAQARPLAGPEDIAKVALTLCHDAELAKMLGEILDIIGPEGCLLVEDGYTAGLSRQYVEGVHWNEGYLSPYFITDQDKQEVRLDGPLLLISDLRLSGAEELVPLLERLVAAHCPALLVIADEVSGSALSLLLANHRGGTLPCAAVRAPFQGAQRAQILADLAVLTGGRVVSAASGERAAHLGLDDLGRATHVWVNAGNFGVHGGDADPLAVRRRIAEVKAALAATEQGDEREQVRRRLGKLLGGVAMLYIGAASEGLQRVRKGLAQRTVQALRLALEAGVVPGGGAAYLECRRSLQGPADAAEGRAAFAALGAALEEPLAVIATNAGFDRQAVIGQLATAPRGQGFDAETGQVLDMWRAGILDPVPVLQTALEVAVSAAVMVLTSDVLIHKRDPLKVVKP